MKLYTLLWTGLLLTGLSGCTSKKISGIDSLKWKKDGKGCYGYRKALIDTIIAQKELVKKMDEHDLYRIFGQPEQVEKMERNRKHFMYFVSEGIQCEVNKHTEIKGDKLVFELDAIGKVRMVRKEIGMP